MNFSIGWKGGLLVVGVALFLLSQAFPGLVDIVVNLVVGAVSTLIDFFVKLVRATIGRLLGV